MKKETIILMASIAMAACTGNAPKQESAPAAEPAAATTTTTPAAEEAPVAEGGKTDIETPAAEPGTLDTPPATPEALKAAEPFLGTWGAGRCSVIIGDMYEGAAFSVSIYWSNGAAENYNWEYVCTYDAENNRLVADKTGTKQVTTFTSEDESTTDVKYEDGSATFFILDNGNLRWNDLNENAGEDLELTK